MCVDCEPIAKASSAIIQYNRRLETRARPLSAALSAWLMRYATAQMRDVRRKLKVGGYAALRSEYVRKNISPSDITRLEDDLLKMLIRHGMAQAKEGGQESVRGTGERWIVKPTLLEEIARAKETKVKLVMAQNKQDVRDSIKRIVGDAMKETPQPTVTELGRRIARQWFGPAGKAPSGRSTAETNEHLFSFTRAHTIARNEVGQSRAIGQAQAYSEVGIEMVGWLSYTNDGRSGKRMHWKMNDHDPISVADMNGRDRSKWFKLPNGERAPYPKWMGLSAFNVIN